MSVELDIINKKISEKSEELIELTNCLVTEYISDPDSSKRAKIQMEFELVDGYISFLNELKDEIVQRDAVKKEQAQEIDRLKTDTETQIESLKASVKKALQAMDVLISSQKANVDANELAKEVMEHLKLRDVPSIEFPNTQLPDAPDSPSMSVNLPEDAKRNSASASYSACDKCVNYNLKDVRVKSINICCSDPTYNPFEGCGGCYYEMDSFNKEMRGLAEINTKLREDAVALEKRKRDTEAWAQYVKDKAKIHIEMETARWNSTMAMFNLKKTKSLQPFYGCCNNQKLRSNAPIAQNINSL